MDDLSKMVTELKTFGMENLLTNEQFLAVMYQFRADGMDDLSKMVAELKAFGMENLLTRDEFLNVMAQFRAEGMQDLVNVVSQLQANGLETLLTRAEFIDMMGQLRADGMQDLSGLIEKLKADGLENLLTRTDFIDIMTQLRADGMQDLMIMLEQLKDQGKADQLLIREEFVTLMAQLESEGMAGLLTRDDFIEMMKQLKSDEMEYLLTRDDFIEIMEQLEIEGGTSLLTRAELSKIMEEMDNRSKQLDGMVTRVEFMEMMTMLRDDLAKINDRFNELESGNEKTDTVERTMIKVQQVPVESKQKMVEEIFEIKFDFDKAVIKPEYADLIKKLAETTRANKNVKVSIVGHTDTSGSNKYNYALGGERAESVENMLIKYGIPASQIVVVSAGENDNKVPTGNNKKNADNRRVRVVKEMHYTEPTKPSSFEVVEQVSTVTETKSGQMYGG